MVEILYDSSNHAMVRANEQRLRRKLRVELLIFCSIMVFLQAFAFAQFRTFASSTPVAYQLLLHLMLLGILVLGVLIGIERFRGASCSPMVTSDALVFSKSEQYALRSIREIQMSPMGDLIVLHFDRRLRRFPLRLTIGLRGSTIPDSAEFVAVLRKAWEEARLAAGDA